MSSRYPFPQIHGVVQAPLVLLLWSALVLFFGHQYQAFALLPDSAARHANNNQQAQRFGPDSHQRVARLLAEMVQQAPPEVPKLLDPQDFALDLAVALAVTDVASGQWSISADSENRELTQGQNPPAEVPDVKVVEKSPAPKTKTKATAATRVRSGTRVNTAPKFVRLPARALAKPSLRVDPLRELKNQARQALSQGHSVAAYNMLRARIKAGRADIEFLGLLALASLSQQPAEARVLYQHLAALQPDENRWRQALALLAKAAVPSEGREA